MTKKPFANVKSPLIGAVLEKSFRFSDIKQAEETLDNIEKHFVLSKDKPDEEDTIMLWIYGYDITAEEEKKGYLGNYAVISTRKVEEDKYTLFAKKIEKDVKYHPQRVRKKTRHPNWGHPVLRAVKKGKLYTTISAAREVLKQLHEEYPNVTIPCTNKTYAMIYSRQTKPPVQKYVLTIEVDKEGYFYIKCVKNEYQKPYEKKKEEQPEEPMGFHAAKQELRTRQVAAEPKKEKVKGKFTEMIEKRRKK